MFLLKVASRKRVKLRIGLFGPQGSGKTMSALKLARGLCDDWNEIAVIDTENGSAELYSHLGPFLHCDLTPPFTTEKFINYIKLIKKEAPQIKVIILDSISHEYSGIGGLLEKVDEISTTQTKGNSFQAWGKVTPKHQQFLNAILYAPCHIICCGRTKNEFAVSTNEKGKSVPQKIGLKVDTKEGFEYEMTIAFRLEENNYAFKDKDRTDLFSKNEGILISEKTGMLIRKWNDEVGEFVDEKNAPLTSEERSAIYNSIIKLIHSKTDSFNNKSKLDKIKEVFKFTAREEILTKEDLELKSMAQELEMIDNSWFESQSA